MVLTPGRRCAVHRVWSAGPGPDCRLCRRPILRGELWAYRKGQLDHPVHAACVNRKRKPPTRTPTQQPPLF